MCTPSTVSEQWRHQEGHVVRHGACSRNQAEITQNWYQSKARMQFCIAFYIVSEISRQSRFFYSPPGCNALVQ